MIADHINGNDTNNSDSDSDTPDLDEIHSLFSSCSHVLSQPLGPKYILHISATSESNPNIAAALSDFSCDVFNLTNNQVAKVTQLKEHNNKIVGCRFSPGSNNLIYTASNDGTVKLWDLREPKGGAMITFTDTTLEDGNPIKTLASFDISPCDRLLAAGTDLIGGDAYILFWDVRNTNLLGAYWESHTDDITQVKFHPENSNKLMSGSTDGLICIYDLFENSEDDALKECLNTGALVEDLEWFEEGNKLNISCITSTNDLQLWKNDGAEPYSLFNRSKIGSQIKIQTDDVYISKIHSLDDSLLVLAGSNAHEGKSFRSLQVSNGMLLPAFRFAENTQRVRSSWFNKHTKLLLTGGEKGKLDIWKLDVSVLNRN